MRFFCLVVVTVVVDVVFVVVIVLDVVQVPFKVYLRLLEMEVEFWWVWWDGGLWWAVLVCRPIFMSNPTQLSWKEHLPCAVRQDVYYLSNFCPFRRQKVEKAPFLFGMTRLLLFTSITTTTTPPPLRNSTSISCFEHLLWNCWEKSEISWAKVVPSSVNTV